jgi:hypothetical protein
LLEQLEVVQSSFCRLERDDAELTRYVLAARQQVQDRADTLVTWVHRARDVMLRDVKTREEDARQRMCKEKDAISTSMKSLSTLVSRVARAAPDNADVVWLRRDLKAVLLSDNRLSQLKELSENPKASWNWSYDVTGANVISRDVAETYLGRLADGAPDDLKRPLTLTGVSERLSKVETQTADLKDLKALVNTLKNKMGKLT